MMLGSDAAIIHIGFYFFYFYVFCAIILFGFIHPFMYYFFNSKAFFLYLLIYFTGK